MRLDHIGFLTGDVDQETAAFDALFGKLQWTNRFEDPLQDVVARFGRTPEGLVYELVQPLSEKSPVSQSLKAKRNIINHLCYRCENLNDKGLELRRRGAVPVGAPKPGVAFSGNLIQFFYLPTGMLIEIIEGTDGPFA
jgi:methylmalonyl-CoA/ethylmalonyl-CoA epimerase